MLRSLLRKSRTLRLILLLVLGAALSFSAIFVYASARTRAEQQRLEAALARLEAEGSLIKVGPAPIMKVSSLVVVTVRGEQLSTESAHLLSDARHVEGVKIDGPLAGEVVAALNVSFADGGDGRWWRRRGKS